VFRKNEPTLADEVGEQAQLGRSQFERLAGARSQAGLLVDDDLAGFDRRTEAASTPEHCAHTGK
jgi:hypothetical protein